MILPGRNPQGVVDYILQRTDGFSSDGPWSRQGTSEWFLELILYFLSNPEGAFWKKQKFSKDV